MSKKQDTKLPKDHIQAIVNIGGQGTGFLCSPSFDNPHLFFVVSNSHVLKSFTKKTDILLSHPSNDFYKDRRLLDPYTSKVYRHPDENIDLACIVVYQKMHRKPESPEQFHVKALTLDYFTELQTPISNNSRLIVVGYPKGESYPYEPLIQEENLVCDIHLKDHHLAIKPSLAKGASGSPVFIERDGRFFVLGVVESQWTVKGQDGDFSVSIIIKQRYVSELLDYATESFKQQHGMTPTLLIKTLFVK